jgi:protocatechuate 3,4-dioxygenase beta subunit
MAGAFRFCRRRFVAGIAAAGAMAFALPFVPGRIGAPTALAQTPACDDGDDPTPAQTEGPFYTPRSPERFRLREDGMPGTPITLSGVVLARSCRPVPNALVDLWHADDAGNYDNEGFRLRGHQFTDGEGRYVFTTIVPGLYPGRTRHFHVKFQAANRPVLTTQLYFPGEPRNEGDPLFEPALLLRMGDPGTAEFVTVLDID